MKANISKAVFGNGAIEVVCAEEMHKKFNAIIHDIELFGCAKLVTHRDYVTAALVPIHSPECLKIIINRTGSCQRCLEHQPEPYIIR